jgi:hypothetical protein
MENASGYRWKCYLVDSYWFLTKLRRDGTYRAQGGVMKVQDGWEALNYYSHKKMTFRNIREAARYLLATCKNPESV